jgi:misacylated tRNA(Ala) deacylase
MTDLLFREDAYLKNSDARVVGINDLGGILLDQTLFYPTGGGQPGDCGYLVSNGQKIPIVTTIKGDADQVILVPAEGTKLPTPGATIEQHLDWGQRYNHMRIHTALHLLSVVIPLPVTGGQISADKGRLDFAMPEALEDKEAVESALNDLIRQDLEVSESWITNAELAANPTLVKTMSVKPPMGAGHVRLIRIGTEDTQIDLQPCGGTHVKRTSEIGPMRLGKIQNKGKQNRRVNIHFADI